MAQSASGILTVVCPDRPGIVAAITGFLAGHGANILDLQQHSDLFDQTFFMRVEFDPIAMDIGPQDFGPLFAPVAEPFGMRWRLRFSDQLLSMAIMVSREEHCLIDLLARHRIGELRVCIPLIISNHSSGACPRGGPSHRPWDPHGRLWLRSSARITGGWSLPRGGRNGESLRADQDPGW